MEYVLWETYSLLSTPETEPTPSPSPLDSDSKSAYSAKKSTPSPPYSQALARPVTRTMIIILDVGQAGQGLLIGSKQ